MPHSKRSLLDHETPDKLSSTEEDADSILVHGKWVTFNDSSTDLDENHLDNESEDNNTDELGISHDTGEDVEFSFLDLTSVDLVEELHEDEGLEDHGVVKELLGWIATLLFAWVSFLGSLVVIFGACRRIVTLHLILPASEFLKGVEVVVLWLVFYLVLGVGIDILPELERPVSLVEFAGIECIVFVASLKWIIWILVVIAGGPVNLAHPAWECEHDNHEDSNLVDSVTEDISPHDWGDDRVVLIVWLSLEDLHGWWFSGKGESAEGVHDQVNPEHLDGSKW